MPAIVYVFPDPVYPYAKIVAEYPSNADNNSSVTLH